MYGSTEKERTEIPNYKANVANFSSCKLNADSIYVWCDLHPVSSLQVKRKQMLWIVRSLNSSERDPGQHSCVRFALYFACEKVVDCDSIDSLDPQLWISISSPFPLTYVRLPAPGYDRMASFMKHVDVSLGQGRKPFFSTGNGRVAYLKSTHMNCPLK